MEEDQFQETQGYTPVPPPNGTGKYVALIVCGLLVAFGVIASVMQHMHNAHK